MPPPPTAGSPYRRVGVQLAQLLNDKSQHLSSPSALQGLAADLAGGHNELTLPLKDLLSRPAFGLLIPMAGSGSGVLQRDALLQEMSLTYAPALVSGLSELLNGFLGLVEKTHQPSWTTTGPDTATQQAAVDQAPGASSEGPKKVAGLQKSADEPPPASSGSTAQPGRWRPALFALAAALLAGGALAGLRNEALCHLLGQCSNSPLTSKATQQALTAGIEAEQQLKAATTLEAYRSALERMERELLKLSGDAMVPDQQKLQGRLQNVAIKARQRLTAEEGDQRRLERAEGGLTAATAASGAAREQERSAVRKELDGIPAGSFSSPAAASLHQRLEALPKQEEPITVESETAAPSQPQVKQPAAQPQASPAREAPPVAQPRASSRREAPSQAAPQEPAWRDEPLF